MLNKAIAVNAVLMVSTLPIQTYTKNEMTETRIGALTQSAENMIEFNRAGREGSIKLRFGNHKNYVPRIIHLISASRASKVRWIHLSSQAKNLINLTAPMSSFRTPILLSLAALTPF